MHVLSIAPILPFPPNHGWRVRTWHLLRSLAQHHDVTLMTWVRPDEAPEHLRAVRDEIGQLIGFPLGPAPSGRVARLARRARFLAGGLPPYVQEMFTERGLLDVEGMRAVHTAIEALHKSHPIDVVVFEEEAMRLMPVEPVEGVPVAVHRLDVFEPLMRELRRSSMLGRAYSVIEAPRWGSFDRAVLEGTDLIVSTSAQTIAALEPYHGGLPTTIVPNGVELRRLRTPAADSHDVAILGSMDYGPNVDGAVWFVREVWPLVRSQCPESRLRLVGRDPLPSIRALAGPDVDVTGTVPDVAAACEGVRVGAVPLRSGMGIKNKTLDFMSMGLPVVTTPHGAEGVDATADDGMQTVAADPGALASSICALLADSGRAAQLGDASYAYVERWHSWAAIGAAYGDDLATLGSGH